MPIVLEGDDDKSEKAQNLPKEEKKIEDVPEDDEEEKAPVS